MESKLYVGNLPYTATPESLSELFSQAGTVESADIIKERDTGRSKGFGFVSMSSAEEAQKAIQLFNGYSFNGRPLTVNIARPREERGGGGGGGGFRGGGNRDRRGGGGGYGGGGNRDRRGGSGGGSGSNW
jgi:RNA recognition motif-containing protein